MAPSPVEERLDDAAFERTFEVAIVVKPECLEPSVLRLLRRTLEDFEEVGQGGRKRSSALRRLLENRLQLRQISRHLLAGLSNDNQGHKNLANSVTFEVDRDRQSGPVVSERFD